MVDGKIIGIEVFDLGGKMGMAWEDKDGKRHAFRLDLPVRLKLDWEQIFKWHEEHNPVGE